MDRGWKHSDVHARKSRYCEVIFNGDSGEISERKEEYWKKKKLPASYRIHK